MHTSGAVIFVSVLILGIGNLLLGDEGAGVRAVEALAERYHIPEGVEVVDGGTAGAGLLDTIAGRERVIVVDAVRTGAEPGTIVRLERDEISPGIRQRISPHQLGIDDVLAVLTVIDKAPRELIIIGMEPAEIDFRVGLSSVIEAKLDALVDAVVAELGRLGFVVKPQQASAEAAAAGKE